MFSHSSPRIYFHSSVPFLLRVARLFASAPNILYGAPGALSEKPAGRPRSSTINPEEKDRFFLSSINDNRYHPGIDRCRLPTRKPNLCACMLECLSGILRGGAISQPGILGEQIDVPYDLLGMAFPTLYKLYLEQ
ncbi:hypothetical protein PGT21_012146 [Puccinia graminis f. sp. tritici]|uniref:Uncharacterized protein n=1 Tax=Puccinia graminis f. sp. tritici TaxID=56615 RepID=A0A5B0QAK6_PUCGR|nr:hypothetical protein PGT21_012146 [Puccinia graminis f. sp. tritici]